MRYYKYSMMVSELLHKHKSDQSVGLQGYHIVYLPDLSLNAFLVVSTCSESSESEYYYLNYCYLEINFDYPD